MEITYYFGSLRIFTALKEKTEELIKKGVFSKKTIKYREHNYGFFDVEEISEEYITGFLVKYKDVNYESVDTEQKTRKTLAIHNANVAESRFFIDTKNEIIAYNTSGNLISKTIFEHIFKKLFEEIYEHLFFQLIFDTINEPYDLKSVITQFSSIKRVEISLIPSNPRFNDNWEKSQKRLNDLNATHSREIITNINPEESLNLETPEMSEKFSMANDGYGDVSVRGIIDGKEKLVRLKNNQESIKAPNNDTDATTVWQRLKIKLDEILKRFKNEN